MTLNITLLTRRAIYQSADFRLTDPDTNQLITDSSTKVVDLLGYPDWHGFVTYTGVGRWPRNGRDTSQWVMDWLQGTHDARLNDIIDVLVTEGTRWLATIRQATRRRSKHSFIIAAFVEAEAQLIVISNFEDCAGRNDAPSDVLSVSRRRFRGRPDVTVTGWKPAVSRQQRRVLQRLAEQYPDDSARVRYAMSHLNETAAKSPLASGTISPECTVVSIRADGHGFQDVSEGSNIEPRSIVNGVLLPDLKQLVASLGVGGGFKSASFASSTPRQSDLAPCRPRTVNPPGPAEYELAELRDEEFETSTARAINDTTIVLGAGTKVSDRGTYYLWQWTPDFGMNELPFICASGSVAMGINDSCQVAFSAAMDDGSGHACRLDGTQAIDLGTFGGRDSGVRQINNQGVIAGWVCIHPEERGQVNFRPAAWSQRNDLEVLTDLPADWGEAVGVNNSGHVLVLGYIRNQAQSFLWKPGDSCTRVGGDRGAGVYPIGINDAGTVLGFGYDSKARHVALLWRNNRQWEPLGTNPGWSVAAINANGDVVGTFVEEGFARPWLRSSSGQIVRLPYFAYHYCQPTAFNSRGDIVGQAATDHGTHALLWRRAN
jgi:uncharacterized membrane protein